MVSKLNIEHRGEKKQKQNKNIGHALKGLINKNLIHQTMLTAVTSSVIYTTLNGKFFNCTASANKTLTVTSGSGEVCSYLQEFLKRCLLVFEWRPVLPALCFFTGR